MFKWWTLTSKIKHRLPTDFKLAFVSNPPDLTSFWTYSWWFVTRGITITSTTRTQTIRPVIRVVTFWGKCGIEMPYLIKNILHICIIYIYLNMMIVLWIWGIYFLIYLFVRSLEDYKHLFMLSIPIHSLYIICKAVIWLDKFQWSNLVYILVDTIHHIPGSLWRHHIHQGTLNNLNK